MTSLELPIPADHPSFRGHFPGYPIVPGVVLLDTAQQGIETATGLRMSGIAMAKFTSPVQPGEALQLDYAIAGDAVRFEIHAGGRKVASGRFTVSSS